MATGEGRMAAQGDFDAGGEPAQVEIGGFRIDAGDDEGGFGEVVFFGDGLQHRIGQP